MAQPEVRGHLHQGLRLGSGGGPWHRRLADLLQWRASAPGPGLSDPMRSLPGTAGNPWTCGQRQRVDHIPTGPSSSTARKGFNRIGKSAIISLPRARVGEVELAGVSLNSPGFLSNEWGPPHCIGGGGGLAQHVFRSPARTPATESRTDRSMPPQAKNALRYHILRTNFGGTL